MAADPAYEASARAKRQVEGGNPSGAVETLEEYLKTDPYNNKLRLQLAQILIYEVKDTKYGMMELDAILDVDPEYVDALIAQVTVLSANKRFNKETDEKYAKIMAIKPTAELCNSYARFLRYQITDFKRAGEYFEKAIAMNPNRYEFHQNYSVLLLNDLKDYQKAKTELEILMEMKPNDFMVKKNYDRLMREKFDENGVLKKRYEKKKRGFFKN